MRFGARYLCFVRLSVTFGHQSQTTRVRHTLPPAAVTRSDHRCQLRQAKNLYAVSEHRGAIGRLDGRLVREGKGEERFIQRCEATDQLVLSLPGRTYQFMSLGETHILSFRRHERCEVRSGRKHLCQALPPRKNCCFRRFLCHRWGRVTWAIVILSSKRCAPIDHVLCSLGPS